MKSINEWIKIFNEYDIKRSHGWCRKELKFMVDKIPTDNKIRMSRRIWIEVYITCDVRLIDFEYILEFARKHPDLNMRLVNENYIRIEEKENENNHN